MATYCDEFSFDDVFEDPSYVQVFVNHSAKVKYPYPSYEDLDYETMKNDKKMELDELNLDDLDFINDESITSSNNDICVNRRGFDTSCEDEESDEEESDEDEEEIFDEYEFYYQREIMMV